MTHRRIRPVAICVIEERGRLFVFRAHDPATGAVFHRPLGGEIEFGESGAECVARELREEIGAQLEGITYLGTIENRFTYAGERSHELVLVYRARFADPARYQDEPVTVQEELGTMSAWWVPLADFVSGAARLVPDALLDLLLRPLTVPTCRRGPGGPPRAASRPHPRRPLS